MMPLWLTIVLALGGSALIGQVVGTAWTHFVKNSSKRIEKRKQEEREELKDTVKSVVNESLEPINAKLITIEKDQELQKYGIQASLRNQLYRLHDKCIEKGYSTRDDKNNFENMYKKYETLGENGVMEKYYQEVLSLPDFK